jgi:hypothetical protein
MTLVIDEYFMALDRLIAGSPLLVEKDILITKDAVAIEAGRGKGSIKRSRAVFADLIVAIDSAASEQRLRRKDPKKSILKARQSAEECRVQLEAALAREISLLNEVYHLKKQLAQLTGSKVIPLRPAD